MFCMCGARTNLQELHLEPCHIHQIVCWSPNPYPHLHQSKDVEISSQKTGDINVGAIFVSSMI